MGAQEKIQKNRYIGKKRQQLANKIGNPQEDKASFQLVNTQFFCCIQSSFAVKVCPKGGGDLFLSVRSQEKI